MKRATRVICALLAVMVLATSGVFAASSKSKTVYYKSGKSGEYRGYTANKKATFVKVKQSTRKTIKSKVIYTSFKKGGVKYTVNKIAKNAFKGCKKLKKITYKGKVALTVQKGAFSGLKTKKITFKVTKKMSKANFKKLKKNLKKAGFKGKIKRG